MKHIYILVLTLFVFISGYSLELLIVHTNDHHGNLFNYTFNNNDVPGLAERAFIIKNMINNHPNYLLLDAGDMNTGQYESRKHDAEPDIKAYNIMGYHAVTIGNHEFYAGFDRLKKQIEWAEFPFLCANITYNDGTPVGVPYIIKTMPNGLKVAIFGLTTPTLETSMPTLMDRLVILDEVDVAQKLVPELRKQADIVIALTHLGIAHTDPASLPFPFSMMVEIASIRLAKRVSGIDLIIDGHSHTVLEKPIIVNNTPIVQAGERGRYIGKAILEVSPNTKKVTLKEWESITLMQPKGHNFKIDVEVFNYLSQFRSNATEQVIGKSGELLTVKDIRNQPTPLGRFVSDAFMNAVKELKPDLAITNSGGIRSDIPKGDIRVVDVYNVLPFENTLVMVDLTGTALIEIINHSLSNAINTGGFMQFSSNVTVSRDSVIINRMPVNPVKVYKVVTNSYTASGGDGYRQFSEALRRVETGIVDKQALLQFIISNY